MKIILLWDPRFPAVAPRRLYVHDDIASAAVRAGVACAADPAQQGALAAGAAVSADDLRAVALQHGPAGLERLAHVVLPLAVAKVASALGLVAAAAGTAPIPTAPAVPPIISQSVMSFAAVNITGLADGAPIADGSWVDSKSGATVVNLFGAKPTYKATGFGGQPTVRFTGSEALDIGRPAALLSAYSGEATLCVTVANITGGNDPGYSGPFGQTRLSDMIVTANAQRQGKAGAQYYNPPPPFEVLIFTKRTGTYPSGLARTGRAFLNGMAMRSGSALATTTGTANWKIGTCADAGEGTYYGFQGDVVAVDVYDKPMRFVDVVEYTKAQCAQYNQPLPWASLPYFPIFFGDSITDQVQYNGDQNGMVFQAMSVLSATGDRLDPALLGKFANFGQSSAQIRDVREIMERELPGLSAALNKPLLVICSEWPNTDDATAAAQWDATFASAKSIDPTCKIAFWTSINKATSDRSADAPSEPIRQAFNSYFYDATRPGGVAAGRSNVDLVIPAHTNARLGVSGAASTASTRNANFFDAVHPYGAGGDDGARELGAVIIGPALKATGWLG